MANYKQPIRTYQRKTVRKPLINISLVPPVVSIQKHLVQNGVNNNENCNDSIVHDPFETTFDRIAKGAVVPPLPLDTNQNNSWGSNSDSDINNVTNLVKSPENTSCNPSVCNDILNLTHENVKRTRKYKKPQKCTTQVISTCKKTRKVSKKENRMQYKQQKIEINNVQGQKRMQYRLKKSRQKYNDCIYHSDTTSDLNNTVHKDIKPCFIKLDAYAIQNWYILNRERIMKNKQNIKHYYTNILQTSMDTFKIQNTTSQSFVTNKEVNDEVNEINTSYIACGHNLSNKATSHHNTNIDSVILGKERNKAHLIKDSFIKIERLNMEKFAEKKVTLLNKKEKYVVSSTPIGKHMRSAHLILLSPIKNNCDILNRNSVIIAKENVPINISPKQEDSTRSLNASECYKIDTTNIGKQQTEVLSFQKLSLTTDLAVKIETTSTNENIHPALTQKCNAQSNVEMRFPYSLNISASTDRSRSLFGDTMHSCDSMEDIIRHDTEKKGLSINNVHTDISSGRVTPLKVCISIKTEISENLDDIEREREYKNQEEQSIEMNTMEIVGENSKNETVNDSIQEDSLSNSRDELSSNTIDVRALLTKLQDPIRITTRMRYSKWHPSILSISQSLNNGSTLSNNEMLHHVTIDDCSNVPSIEGNLEHSESTINPSLDCPKSLDNAIQQQHNDNINIEVQRSVFLKPGKCWARSLSILNNVNPESNLDKLCVGKGKKWRYSVKNILDMQKQGTCWNYVKKHQDNTHLSCGRLETSIISSLDDKCKTVNYDRLSKRISVRVVPNASVNCGVKSDPFLEAFGITVENLSSKLEALCEEESSIRNIEDDGKNRMSKSHSVTAKDVVLQRCSQKHYLPFSNCFPDSYLEYCRKIGEGVYGEVFLYEHDDEKSVIKIIPIEGEELVNGEQQKKFSEILSEIVIAEELHNLRLRSTCKTSAFVEVRGIKCVIGKYPEKLVKLWNIYDDDKRSDNDCPSMFGEHQLYIVLELGHGGENLEAFVFQTAEEAYASFLQTALALAVAEKAVEFEHRDLHWGNILISRTKESYIYYNLNGKEIKFPSNNIKVSIIDYTLSRMVYQGCCIYNDLALDPALFTAHGEYQFEVYRLMRDKIQNNWQKFEPYTNILWLHYVLDKIITAVRYKRKNLKVHKQAINKLKELQGKILNYDSAYDFVNSTL